ncbi:Hypothetical protein, putative [Bodo saltans]|uniref:CSD domain-containing protein n=1 Tax=Bodo saltans TaxID=75058 RepID=A0A0S4JW69_BODSA|nr:Hypothetical protein, putative [Bodo saltans]|eukprot:CUG93665.1 Hypothetical protein, putative [Bodo saltans]
MFRKCSVKIARVSSNSVPVTGTVLSWENARGVGRVALDASSSAGPSSSSSGGHSGSALLVGRGALHNGHFLTPGQRIRAHQVFSKQGQPRLALVRNEDGTLVRPRSLRGVILEYSPVVECGEIGETDLCGNYIPDVSPKYRFSLLDYSCRHPPPAVGQQVIFHKEEKPADGDTPAISFARRIALHYVSKGFSDGTGTVHTLNENFGFVSLDGTSESIFFRRSAAFAGVQVGSRVTFWVSEEPPVSTNAGKLLAIALRPFSPSE